MTIKTFARFWIIILAKDIKLLLMTQEQGIQA
jgi:hypothetical protein